MILSNLIIIKTFVYFGIAEHRVLFFVATASLDSVMWYVRWSLTSFLCFNCVEIVRGAVIHKTSESPSNL